MIRVRTIDDLEPALRDRIKAKVMRRLIDHLRERPEVEDAALRRVFGFDRAGLDALYFALSRPQPVADDFVEADERVEVEPAAIASLAPVRSCCAGRSRD